MTAKRRWEIGAGVALAVVLMVCAGWVIYRRELDRSLGEAIERHDRAAVRFLLQRGADVNIAGPQFGVTALVFVLRQDPDPKLVKMLLDRGAKVNGRTMGRATPLMTAIGDSPDQTANRLELLKRGADINAQDGAGTTALMYAAWTGQTETVRMLLKHGADPNLRNTRNWTALTQMLGHPKIIRLLKEAGGKR